MITSFTRAGERTWMAGYAYDFAAVGVLMYLSGDNVKASRGDLDEQERDITVGYVVQSGALKGFGITWRNCSLRGSATTDTDENRIYLSYSLALLPINLLQR